MDKKPVNWPLIWKLGTFVIAISVAILIIFCVNNPQSELALKVYEFTGEKVSYAHLIWFIPFYFLWGFIFARIKESHEVHSSKKQSKNAEKSPNIQTHAKVICKNSVATSYRPGMQDYVYVYDTLSITFETQDGRRLVFSVTQEQYSQYLENDIGVLSYKECDGQLFFINFERQAQPSN